VIVHQKPEFRSIPFYLISKPKKKEKESPSKTLIEVVEPNFNTPQEFPTKYDLSLDEKPTEILPQGFLSDDIINDFSSLDLEIDFSKYLHLEEE
jgi:hypothetical protein